MTTVRDNHGLACPKCGRDDKLQIARVEWYDLTPDGLEPQYSREMGMDWGPTNACFCGHCRHMAPAGTFVCAEGGQ